jgi:hypothetical protein
LAYQALKATLGGWLLETGTDPQQLSGRFLGCMTTVLKKSNNWFWYMTLFQHLKTSNSWPYHRRFFTRPSVKTAGSFKVFEINETPAIL